MLYDMLYSMLAILSLFFIVAQMLPCKILNFGFY